MDIKKSECTSKFAKENGMVPDLNYGDPVTNQLYLFSDNLCQLMLQHRPQQIVPHDFPQYTIIGYCQVVKKYDINS